MELAVQENRSVAVNMRQATDVAGACREIVMKTAQQIGRGVKKFVCVEGWNSIAVAHGCVASARDVERVEGGFRAIGEVKRMDNGMVIATAEGFVGDDEPTWANRPTYAKRAMAQTRAISRACRSAFAHVVVLIDSNLSTTPAEEVPEGGFSQSHGHSSPIRIVSTSGATTTNSPKAINVTFSEEETLKKDFAKSIASESLKEIKESPKRDMTLNFGKHKGMTLRQIALMGEEGLGYLDWLSKQELKLANDGKPFKRDIERNEIIAEILAENPEQPLEGGDDDLPF